MAFRIALGRCDAKNADTWPVGATRLLCNVVNSRLEQLKALSAEQLMNLPKENFETAFFGGERVEIATIHEVLDTSEHLFVVRAFRRTFKWPNFISIGAVGQLATEGIVLRSSGALEDASENLLWYYR